MLSSVSVSLTGSSATAPLGRDAILAKTSLDATNVPPSSFTIAFATAARAVLCSQNLSKVISMRDSSPPDRETVGAWRRRSLGSFQTTGFVSSFK